MPHKHPPTGAPGEAKRGRNGRVATRTSPPPEVQLPAPADLQLSVLVDFAMEDVELGRDERVRRLAWRLYERRGGEEGRAVEDWLQAESLIDALNSPDLQAQASANGGH